jgi:hypothetical protein
MTGAEPGGRQVPNWQRPSLLSWLTLDESPDLIVSPGGIVVPLIPAAALLLGDAVYLSADKTVNKSAVAANGALRCGIVVGGDATGDEITDDVAAYGVRQANLANGSGRVWVCFLGVAYVICDAAIAVGVGIAPSVAVAGRVRPAVALGVAAGAVAVTSAAANGLADISGDSQTKVLGTMLEASGGAAQVKLALIGMA